MNIFEEMKKIVDQTGHFSRGALKQAINMVNKAVPKKPYPIANTPSGMILLSNKRAVPGPQLRKAQDMLNILIKNTLSQTAYTPQAQKHIRNMDVKTAFFDGPGGYYSSGMKIKPHTSYANQRPPTYRTNPEIMMNAQYLGKGYGIYPINLMRHELLHSMDQNAQRDLPERASFSPTGKTSAKSYGFYNTIQRLAPRTGQYINNRYSGIQNFAPRGQDIEGYATGGQRGNNVLLNPVTRPYYSTIYKPVSKQINSSPVFPSQDYLRHFINKLLPDEE